MPLLKASVDIILHSITSLMKTSLITSETLLKCQLNKTWSTWESLWTEPGGWMHQHKSMLTTTLHIISLVSNTCQLSYQAVKLVAHYAILMNPSLCHYCTHAVFLEGILNQPFFQAGWPEWVLCSIITCTIASKCSYGVPFIGLDSIYWDSGK